jgi:pyruvate/2-oxoglutarate dehydrogenase complex dihydrolipoamide dehydrogenase (E3) component
MQVYKYLVVGAGQTGIKFATLIAKKLKNTELRIGLIEDSKIGGTFLFGSDLPLKYLGQEAQKLKDLESYISESKNEFYLQSVNRVLTRIKQDEQNLKNKLSEFTNLDLIQGKASFISKTILEVKNEETRNLLSFQNTILTVGKNRMVLPDIKGLRDVDFLFQYNIVGLEKLPESMAVLGITENNLKMAEILSTFGVKIVIIEKLSVSAILPNFDRSPLNHALKNLAINGITFLFETEVLELKNIKPKNKKQPNQIEIRISGGKTLTFQSVYVQAKELFEDNSLGLAKAGVGYSENGIFANSTGQTNNSKIYVFGEASANTSQSYKNNSTLEFIDQIEKQQQNPIQNFFNKQLKTLEINYFKIDLFSPIITLGLTSHQARNIYGEIATSQVYTFLGKTGFIKLIYIKSNQRLLGISLAGEVAIENELLAWNLLINQTKLNQVFKILTALGGSIML